MREQHAVKEAELDLADPVSGHAEDRRLYAALALRFAGQEGDVPRDRAAAPTRGGRDLTRGGGDGPAAPVGRYTVLSFRVDDPHDGVVPAPLLESREYAASTPARTTTS